MKLLVIVLCLICERYFLHSAAHKRFQWFSIYINEVDKRLSKISLLSSPSVIMSLILLPPSVVIFCTLSHFSTALYGFVGFLLNVIILYYCLGPGNPFYPAHESTTEMPSRDEVGEYLAKVNGQLCAVIFWYIILGPVAALLYRLISLCCNQPSLHQLASSITNILDWVPARIMVLLYLLVGNFQVGLRNFSKLFFKPPAENQNLLGVCGLQALDAGSNEPIMMSRAENLVEHAAILLLALLAICTLVAWM